MWIFLIYCFCLKYLSGVNADRGESVGCFALSNNTASTTTEIGGNFRSVDECVTACAAEFFSDAALSEGHRCSCLSESNSQLFSTNSCTTKCPGNDTQLCGGENSYSVYHTGITAPGPPSRLSVISRTESNLVVEWDAPRARNGLISGYAVNALSIGPAGNEQVSLAPLSWSFGNNTFRADLVGLAPATKYNVSVVATAETGSGVPKHALFTTDIKALDPPPAPEIIRSSPGQITLRLRNIQDPTVTSYQLIVANDDVKTIDQNRLVGKLEAESERVPYYVTAEISPRNFSEEFVVGDSKIYGGFVNSPLDDDRGYVFSLSAVVSIDGHFRHFFSPLSPAGPKEEPKSNQQEQKEEVVRFESKTIDDDEHFSSEADEQRLRDKEDLVRRNKGIRPPAHLEPLPPLIIGLVAAIAVGGILLLLTIVAYFYLRQRANSGGLTAVSQQRLANFSGSVMEMDSSFVNTAFGRPTGIEPANQLESLKERTTVFDRNVIGVGDYVGNGHFGMMHRGSIVKGSTSREVLLYLIRDREQDPVSREGMLQHLSVLVRVGSHHNVVSLVGISEDQDILLIATEAYHVTLKETLLGSRTLTNYPAYAEKEKRFSTMHEAQIVDIAIGVARGMAYLSSLKVVHRRLCARNVMMADGSVPKITGFTVQHHNVLSDKPDYRRWLSPETLRSQQFPPKSDVWSFGVFLWELFTLGGTPYVDVRSQDVSVRVPRGLRLSQPSNISEDLFQVMLQCWQIDLDERPGFSDLVEILSNAFSDAVDYVTFNLSPGFKYEPYQIDKEFER